VTWPTGKSQVVPGPLPSRGRVEIEETE
jgi:hypothetical protein